MWIVVIENDFSRSVSFWFLGLFFADFLSVRVIVASLIAVVSITKSLWFAVEILCLRRWWWMMSRVPASVQFSEIDEFRFREVQSSECFVFLSTCRESEWNHFFVKGYEVNLSLAKRIGSPIIYHQQSIHSSSITSNTSTIAHPPLSILLIRCGLLIISSRRTVEGSNLS